MNARRQWLIAGGVLVLSTGTRATPRAPIGDPIRLAQASAADQPARAPDVPYVPTRMEVVDRMLDIAQVGRKDRLLDLGCGDGRIVVRAAERFGTHGIGVDIDPNRIRDAQANAKRRKVEALTRFELGDVFTYDVSKATVVTMYLLPSVNLELKPRLRKELKAGTRLVSHDFDMGADWKPDATEKVGGDWIYLWRIPSR